MTPLRKHPDDIDPADGRPPAWTAERTAEAIDCCRAGHGDAENPAHAELAGLMELLAEDRTWQQYAVGGQRFDLAVLDAMASVEVPPGSAERLAQRLSQAAAAIAPADQSFVTSRRRWMAVAVGGGLSLAASVALAVWWRAPSAELTYEQLLDQVELWQAREPELSWTALAESSPPRRFHPPAQALIPGSTRWTRVRDVLGRDGVLYELSAGVGRQASLLVLEARGTPPLAALPVAPPTTPRTTHNKASGAWVEGGVLYVLLVDGGVREFRTFLPSGGPIA